MSTSSRILTTATLAIAFLSFSATQAQAVQIEVLGDYCGGSVSSGSSCFQLGDRYDVTGGGVVDPAEDKASSYLTPGSLTGDPSKVFSYNVVSTKNDPTGATGALTVSNLNGVFEFYWGSVDNHNKVEFFSGNGLVATFTGVDVAAAYDPGLTANQFGGFGFDQYVRFAGEFDTAVLSSSGVAFELATVPEPSVVALLGLGLLGLGLIRVRNRRV